jgi:hypothetical protein
MEHKRANKLEVSTLEASKMIEDSKMIEASKLIEKKYIPTQRSCEIY